MILVEAKFHSGKSANDLGPDAEPSPIDQLAREYDALTYYAQAERSTPVLVYLTADHGLPVDDIESSSLEYSSLRNSEAMIAWLSWRQIESVLRVAEDPILIDLRDCLRRLDLRFFGGFSVSAPGTVTPWRFSIGSLTFSWVPQNAALTRRGATGSQSMWRFHR
jgi:hypothetical protein